MAKPVDKATSRWRTFWHELKTMSKAHRDYEKKEMKRAFRRWSKKDARQEHSAS